MNKIFDVTKFLDYEEVHAASLKLLENTGMKFLSEEMLKALEKKGATIDWSKSVARIPGKFANECLQLQKNDIKKGKKQILLNGGISSRTNDKISCKFGSGAFFVYDWKTRTKSKPDEKGVAESIQFGNAIDDIGMIGVPVIPDKINGERLSPHIFPILRAMLVAKNTHKVGNSEVNTPKQLKYLMEMGEVIKGSRKAYLEDPCFITAKHPVSPLQMDRDACDVLLALAKNSLPANVITMPILGTSVPVTLTGSIILSNAEMIGSMCAVKSIYPEAMILGGVMPAVTDMKTGELSYDNPLAVKVDMAMAVMYDDFYGFDFGLGIYCSDAKYLGAELIMQRTVQLISTVITKRLNPPIGLYDLGLVYSPELALLEIDILKNLVQLFSDNPITENTLNNPQEIDDILTAVNNVKPGGSFLAEEHTLKNFRKTFQSNLLTEIVSIKEDKKIKGMFELANEKHEEIKRNMIPFNLSIDKEKEIDRIVKAACEDILNG
jgi:trimethylamine---corrinoid protein Co-methyltransferase